MLATGRKWRHLSWAPRHQLSAQKRGAGGGIALKQRPPLTQPRSPSQEQTGGKSPPRVPVQALPVPSAQQPGCARLQGPGQGSRCQLVVRIKERACEALGQDAGTSCAAIKREPDSAALSPTLQLGQRLQGGAACPESHTENREQEAREPIAGQLVASQGEWPGASRWTRREAGPLLPFRSGEKPGGGKASVGGRSPAEPTGDEGSPDQTAPEGEVPNYWANDTRHFILFFVFLTYF